MVYGVEIVFDVCFECVTDDVILVLGARNEHSIARDFVQVVLELFDCIECSFALSTGIAVVYESWLKDWF